MQNLAAEIIAPIHSADCIARDGDDCCGAFAYSNFSALELAHTEKCTERTGYDCCAAYPAY
jgi:hypothetical protein